MKNRYKTKKRFHNKKNRTRRVYYGGENESGKQEEEARGIFSHIRKKVSEVSGNVAKYVGDKVALSAGYVPEAEGNKPATTDANGVAAVKEQPISDLPESSIEQIKDTAKEVAHKLSQSLDAFNKGLDTPELREQITKTFDNVSDIASIGIRAVDKPVNEAVEKVGDIVKKVAPEVIEASVNAGLSAAKAVPGVGSVLAVGSMLNDVTAGAEAIVQAGAEAVEVSSDLVKDTIESIDEEKDKLEKETEQSEKTFEDKKKEAEEITNRVSESINKFEDTNKLNNVQNANDKDVQNTSTLSTGGGRTRATRKLRKRKHKASKRVRFYGLD